MVALFKPNVKRLGKKKDIDGLVTALNYEKDPDVRSRAAPVLGEIGDSRAVEPLIEALKSDTWWQVRYFAAEALGKIGDKRAVESLIGALKQWTFANDAWVQKNAINALGKIGNERAVEPIIDCLKQEHWKKQEYEKILAQVDWKSLNERAQAVYLTVTAEWDEVVKIGEPAIEPLIQALKDEDYDGRWKAAEALDKLGWKPSSEVDRCYYLIAKRELKELVKIGKPAVESLIQSLKDRKESVRGEAAEALGEIGDERAVGPLIHALKDEDWTVRGKAVVSLWEIGDERAVESLIHVLKYDPEFFVRKAAAWALGEIGDKRAVEPLIQALKDEYLDVRIKAANALGEIRDERAVEPLINALLTNALIGELEARWEVVNTLMKFKKDASKAILSKPDWRRQIETLWILAKIEKNPEIIPDIISWLFANPRESDYRKGQYSDLYRARNALKTLSARSSLDKELINLLIEASSFSIHQTAQYYYDVNHEKKIEVGEEPGYAIHAIEELCKINNPVTSNILYMISQKKDIQIKLRRKSHLLSFEEQRSIASLELRRRGFTKYDPNAYLKKQNERK